MYVLLLKQVLMEQTFPAVLNIFSDIKITDIAGFSNEPITAVYLFFVADC